MTPWWSPSTSQGTGRFLGSHRRTGPWRLLGRCPSPQDTWPSLGCPTGQGGSWPGDKGSVRWALSRSNLHLSSGPGLAGKGGTSRSQVGPGKGNMGGPGHSCGGGDKGVVRDRAEVIQRAGHLRSTSHQRVTSSPWRRPPHPLPTAPATFLSQLSLCPVSSLPLLGPRPPSLRSDPACPATPSGPDTLRGSTLRTLVFRRSLVTSTVLGRQGVDTQHLLYFWLNT